MITLTVLCILIGIICTVRINRECKRKFEEFNPFEAGFVNWFGFFIGLLVAVCATIYVSIVYLP